MEHLEGETLAARLRESATLKSGSAGKPPGDRDGTRPHACHPLRTIAISESLARVRGEKPDVYDHQSELQD